MATASVERRAATWDEYQALSDDVRAEYVDGEIFVTPRPSQTHQLLGRRLANALEAVLPAGYRGIQEWAWMHGDSEFVPDIMVYAATHERARYTGTPELCVEIVSGNPAHDYITKAHRYAEAGLDHYWILDPADEQLNVLGRTHARGPYELLQTVTRAEPATVPFGVAELIVDLDALWSDLGS